MTTISLLPPRLVLCNLCKTLHEAGVPCDEACWCGRPASAHRERAS